MNNRLILPILPLLVPLIVCAAEVRSQPSRADTYLFLADKVAVDYSYRDPLGGANMRVAAEMTGDKSTCLLKYVKTMSDNGKRRTIIEFSVNLAEVNPASILSAPIAKTDMTLTYGYANPGGLVQFETTRKRPAIARKYTRYAAETGEIDRETTESAAVEHFITADLDSANRAVRAAKHLVTQCGGRDELF